MSQSQPGVVSGVPLPVTWRFPRAVILSFVTCPFHKRHLAPRDKISLKVASRFQGDEGWQAKTAGVIRPDRHFSRGTRPTCGLQYGHQRHVKPNGKSPPKKSSKSLLAVGSYFFPRRDDTDRVGR